MMRALPEVILRVQDPAAELRLRPNHLQQPMSHRRAWM